MSRRTHGHGNGINNFDPRARAATVLVCYRLMWGEDIEVDLGQIEFHLGIRNISHLRSPQPVLNNALGMWAPIGAGQSDGTWPSLVRGREADGNDINMHDDQWQQVYEEEVVAVSICPIS